MSTKTIPLEDAIMKWQEVGLQINELKNEGHDSIPIKSYEYLLEWTIDTLHSLEDQVNSK